MTQQTFNPTTSTETSAENRLRFNLGRFTGFDIRRDSAIGRTVTAQEVVDWEHELDGGVNFWSVEDRPEAALILKRSRYVTYDDLIALDQALQEVGDDSPAAFLRIHYVMKVTGRELAKLTRDDLMGVDLSFYFGTNLRDLRTQAAHEFFQSHWSAAYHAWRECTCSALTFDVDRFLSPPDFVVEEFIWGKQVALLLAPSEKFCGIPY